MVHLYIGDGKGKTTAALGCALRALGWGKKVYCAQFLKDINHPCGEIKAVKDYKLNIKIERFNGQTHPIFLNKHEVDIKKIKRSVTKSLAKIETFIRAKKFDMVILDEVLDTLAGKFISQKILTRIIKNANDTELILTGRTAPSSVVRLADYISFIGKIKHPFDKKVIARKSIDY
ncbi:MAG: cob(I)yrinic acid a,c-diamide adenosyltransferase [Candidatus Omnitrophota bacterium]|nr:cob(I)yrinic acid a,c-diamide adenosyltransferase [Candidatus Omnitrophota bacterium]